MKSFILVCVSASFVLAASGEIRFRAEVLRGPAAEHARQPAETKEFGLVNRVRYRIVRGTPGRVEREPVVPPDPQKGTQARPTPVAGAPWIAETVTAALSGSQIIG